MMRYIVLEDVNTRIKYKNIDMEKGMLNRQRTIVLSTIAIAGVAILFATGPIVGNQQAFAYGGYGRNGHHHHYYYHHHHYYGGGYGGNGY